MAEARDVVFKVEGTRPGLRGPAERDRRAALVFEPLPGWGRAELLDYIDGALYFFDLVGL
jgi:hypothetical protein